MGKMFVKYASVLLVLWYSLSIIGFDVHSCRTTGEVFVASLAAGVTCEDIHPEHSCKAHGGCCQHHNETDCCDGRNASENTCDNGGCHVEKEECCSNEFQFLQITGVNVSENVYSDHGDSHLNQYVFDVDMTMELSMQTCQRRFLEYLDRPDSGVVMPDRQAFLNIWRV